MTWFNTLTVILLTRPGGGAFGSHPEWIDDAITYAMQKRCIAPLDIRYVKF